MSDELTREQYCLIIEELPVEYTDTVGENIDKLLKHDAALRTQLAACQEQMRLTKGALEQEVDKANMAVAHYKGLALGTNPDACGVQREDRS